MKSKAKPKEKICVKCLRQTLRRPYMQVELGNLAELDVDIAKMAILLLEKGLSQSEIARKTGYSQERVKKKLTYAIDFLRGGCIYGANAILEDQSEATSDNGRIRADTPVAKRTDGHSQARPRNIG